MNKRTVLTVGGMILTAHERPLYAVIRALLIVVKCVEKSGKTFSNNKFKGKHIICTIVITISKIKLNKAVINFAIN